MIDFINLPEDVLYIIDTLRSNGHRADIVGGSVRNALLSLPVEDYDLTTDAKPQRIKEIFSHLKTIDTGIKHGTVTLLVGGKSYEITTYRLDGDYLDNRHPDSVCFTSDLSLDLERRDFTVNAMCYNPYDGFTDLFSGLEHLEKKLIVAVGDPRRRFDEDALRILRALRFSSSLGFEIERETASAIFEKTALLKNVAPERIFSELSKLFAGKGAYSVFEKYESVITFLIPELSSLALPCEGEFLSASAQIRMLSLFAPLGADAAKAFDSFCRRLRTDNRFRMRGNAALGALLALDFSSVTSVLFMLKDHGVEATEDALSLAILLGSLPAQKRSLLADALESGIPYSLKSLSLGGSDLIPLGFRGESCGRELNALLCAVIKGEVENRKDLLLEYLSAKHK